MQYSLVESRLLPVDKMPHHTKLESGTTKLAFRFSHTAYN